MPNGISCWTIAIILKSINRLENIAENKIGIGKGKDKLNTGTASVLKNIFYKQTERPPGIEMSDRSLRRRL